MKKKIILGIIFLMICLSIVSAQTEFCQDKIQPGKSCRMVTPIIVCEDYNYSVIHENGSKDPYENLTNFNDSVYYFNFSQPVAGTYLVKLCDNTTREIYVEHEDDRMIAITIGILIMMSFFILVGIINRIKVMKIIGFGIALIQMILMVFLFYANESGADLVNILRTNFYIMLILGFGLGMVTLIFWMMGLLSWQKDDAEVLDDRKW